jgi:hypothetical protein
MAWIEVHQSLQRHPKLARLSGKLRIHRAQSAGHLLFLWLWTLDYAPTGDLSAFGPAEISAAAEYPGDADAFFQSLRETGWIDENGFLHDWYDYAGKLIERRAADKERKRDIRKTSGVVQRTSDGHPADGVRTVPYPTQPNQTKIINHVNEIGPEHLMPARDPPNIPETRATLKKVSEFGFLVDGSYPYLTVPDFATDWTAWLDMRWRMKWDSGPRALVLALNKLHKWPLEKATLSLQLSVERSYRGVFEPKEDFNGSQNGGGGRHPGGYESAAQRNLRKLKANLGLDQPTGNSPAEPDVVLPHVPQGATGGGNAGH